MRYEFPFSEIEGFLSSEDRVNLKMLAEKCADVNGVYVEIGSYCGLSALCINEGMPAKKELMCLDWFEPEKLVKFIANIANAKTPWNIGHITGDFRNTFEKSPEDMPQISFCFCDHDHKLDSTKAVYDYIWPRLSLGGILAFHDYLHEDYQEPRAFLDALPHKRILETQILAFQK